MAAAVIPSARCPPGGVSSYIYIDKKLYLLLNWKVLVGQYGNNRIIIFSRPRSIRIAVEPMLTIDDPGSPIIGWKMKYPR